MLLLALILACPLLGLVAFLMPSDEARPWMLPVGGVVHGVLTVLALQLDVAPAFDGYLALDALGKVVLGFSGLLFSLCSFYGPGYLAQRKERPNRIFIACVLCFFGAMSLI